MPESITFKKNCNVLITGASGSFGRLLSTELSKDMKVLGVDSRPMNAKMENVEHINLDLRHKSIFQKIRKRSIDAIVHIGVIRNPLKHKEGGKAYYYNVETTTRLLELAEQKKVKKFIFLSSANLYGPSTTSSGFLTEDAPLHAADKNPTLRDLVALDMMVQSFFWKVPHIETVIFRPVHVVGHMLNNAPTRYFRLPVLPTMLGYDPMIQAIHAQDLVIAIKHAILKDVRGIFNLTCGEQAPLSRLIQKLGGRAVPIPGFALKRFVNSLFYVNATHFPVYELEHLKFSCLVDDSRASSALGFCPSYSLAQIIDDLKAHCSPLGYRLATS